MKLIRPGTDDHMPRRPDLFAWVTEYPLNCIQCGAEFAIESPSEVTLWIDDNHVRNASCKCPHCGNVVLMQG